MAARRCRHGFSLLTTQEEHDLDLQGEAAQVQARRMRFLSFPIPDRQVPGLEQQFESGLVQLESELASGRNVVLHCRQGIGRTGLVSACLLLTKGIDVDTAVRHISDVRGVNVSETPDQLRWIRRFAERVALRG